MLQIQHFEKWYQQVLILKIPSLVLDEGVYWFKGKNGSGKTTLFTSLAGLIPFKGEVYLNKLNMKKNAVAYRMLVNYSEAEPLYPEWLTGIDLINFIGEAKSAEQKQIEELKDLFNMGSYLAAPVGTYSSGMLKKLSLLLAFLGKPGLIMLDEPLVTLDQQATHSLMQLIKEYRSKGVSFLLSSHQDFAQAALDITATFTVKDTQLFYGSHVE